MINKTISIIIITLITFISSLFIINNNVSATCNSVDDFNSCLSSTKLVKPANMKIEDWFKSSIYHWVKNLSSLLWLFAVAAIAYGWMLMTLSWGEDEKIKKWKDIIKWAMLWFLALISVWSIILVVINIMFWIWW